MFSKFRKLSRQLSLAIMLLAAPIFILSLGALYKHSHYLIHQEVLECSNSTLNTTLHRVRTYMSTIETAVNSNVWMMEEDFSTATLQSVSNRIVRLNSSVISSSIYVVPDMFKDYGRNFSIYTVNQGDTVATYCESEYDYLHRQSFILPVSSGNACWVDPFIEYAEGKVDHNEAVATYCRPIKLSDGRIVGVLTADFSFSRMAKMINEAEHPYPHAYFMLLGGDGRYLIHPDTTRLFRKTIFNDADPGKDKDMITLGHEMTAGQQGALHVHSGGKRYHVCYRPVPGTDWSLALVNPDSDAMRSYHRLGYVIIILIGIGLLVILWFCHYVVRRTIKPVNQLIYFTRKMADGQYDEQIPVTPDNDLFGQLQNSFAKMQQSLNDMMGSLRQKVSESRQHNDQLLQTRLQTESIVCRKNKFIQHVARQMRMPLNVIMGFSDVLGGSSTNKSDLTADEMSNITSMMKSNMVSMKMMVVMLFDATDTDATETFSCQKVDEVSCNEIARQSIRHTLSHFPQAGIRFESQLNDGVFILTHQVYLLRSLRKLLYNAVEYSDGQHVVLRVSQTDTTVRFTIQDVGPGLPVDLPEMEYEPFSITDHLPEGHGYRWPLVKRLIVGLGGRLTVDTDYHEGCKIVIEMPK